MAVAALTSPGEISSRDVEAIASTIYPFEKEGTKKSVLTLLLNNGELTNEQISKILGIPKFKAAHSTLQLYKERERLKTNGIAVQRRKEGKGYVYSINFISAEEDHSDTPKEPIKGLIALLNAATENRIKILEAIQAEGPCTRDQVAESTDIKRKTVDNNVVWLKEKSDSVRHLTDAALTEKQVPETRERVLEIVVLDEGILQALHHDWNDDNSATRRQIMRFLSNKLGEEHTINDMIEATGQERSTIVQVLTPMIKLTEIEEYANALGFRVIRTEERARGGEGRVMKVTFRVETVGERPIQKRTNRKLHTPPRTPKGKVEIPEKVHARISKEVGVKLCKKAPPHSKKLFYSAGLVLRPERELIGAESLYEAAREGKGQAMWPTEIELDMPNKKKLGTLLERLTVPWALELGFVVYGVAYGRHGLFFLDPEEREAKLRKKYAEQPEKLVEFLAPTEKFSKKKFTERMEETEEPVDSEVDVVLNIVARRQHTKEETTTKAVAAEYAPQMGMSPRSQVVVTKVRQIIEKSKREARKAGCFMRVREDKKGTIELLIIDKKRWDPEQDIYHIEEPGLSEEELMEAIPDRSGPKNTNARRVLHHLSLHPGKGFTYTMLSNVLKIKQSTVESILQKIIMKIDSGKFRIEKSSGRIKGGNPRNDQSIYTFHRVISAEEETKDETPREFANRVIKGKKYEAARRTLVLLIESRDRAFTKSDLEDEIGLSAPAIREMMRGTLAPYVNTGTQTESTRGKGKRGKKGSTTWQIKPEYTTNIDYEREDDTEADLAEDELMDEPIEEDNRANEELTDILLVAEEIEGKLLAAALGGIYRILITEKDLQQTNMLNREKARRLLSILFIFAKRTLLTAEANRALSEHKGHILENLSRGGSEADFRTSEMLRQCRSYLLGTYYEMGEEEKAIFVRNRETHLPPAA